MLGLTNILVFPSMSEAHNSRNGYGSKTLQTVSGQFELDTPSDRSIDQAASILASLKNISVDLLHYRATLS